jgi:hypothetical protein
MKVHTMFVIGKRDMEADAVSVRVHGKGNLGAKPPSPTFYCRSKSVAPSDVTQPWLDEKLFVSRWACLFESAVTGTEKIVQAR